MYCDAKLAIIYGFPSIDLKDLAALPLDWFIFLMEFRQVGAQSTASEAATRHSPVLQGPNNSLGAQYPPAERHAGHGPVLQLGEIMKEISAEIWVISPLELNLVLFRDVPVLNTLSTK